MARMVAREQGWYEPLLSVAHDSIASAAVSGSRDASEDDSGDERSGSTRATLRDLAAAAIGALLEAAADRCGEASGEELGLIRVQRFDAVRDRVHAAAAQGSDRLAGQTHSRFLKVFTDV